ncbi:MAG: NAD-dependent epimerase/dehydratase family protein [Mariprofundales bacterium]
MKALVTGVSGFIGRELARQLVAADWQVVGTSRHPSQIEGVQWRYWDLADPPDPELLIGVDVVFHLAGKAHALAETVQDAAEYDRINLEPTRRLLEAAAPAGVTRLVYFSSVKAAGEVTGVMDEQVNAPADTPYGRSKRQAEALVLASTHPAGVVLRPSMVYGAGGKGNLPRMIRAVARGRFPPLPDIGGRRSMVHVADLAQAAILAATRDGAVGRCFIVTDGNDYSVRQIHRWICDGLGKQMPGWTIPAWLLTLLARIGDGIGAIRGRRFMLDSDALHKLLGDARYSNGRLKQELGFVPRYDLQQAMVAMVHQALERSACRSEVS